MRWNSQFDGLGVVGWGGVGWVVVGSDQGNLDARTQRTQHTRIHIYIYAHRLIYLVVPCLELAGIPKVPAVADGPSYDLLPDFGRPIRALIIRTGLGRVGVSETFLQSWSLESPGRKVGHRGRERKMKIPPSSGMGSSRQG